MIILVDLYDIKRTLLAKAGTHVILIADHGSVAIVEDKKGNRFSVNKNKIKEDET